MPSFYLNVRRGPEVVADDQEPREFADLEEARIEALQSLRELAADAIVGARPFDYSGIEITDDNGTKVADVKATEAVPQLAIIRDS